jgi:hypothetical protein
MGANAHPLNAHRGKEERKTGATRNQYTPGHRGRAKDERFGEYMKKQIIFSSISILLFVIFGGAQANDHAIEIKNKNFQTNINNYTIRVQNINYYSNDCLTCNQGTIHIYQNHLLVYAYTNYDVTLFPASYNGRLPPFGKSILGDNTPNIVFQVHTGGAHCCKRFIILALEKNKVKQIADLSGDHSNLDFTDIDGDGKYEIYGKDWTFAYWETSFADSPSPAIILKFTNNEYHLYAARMKQSINTNRFRLNVQRVKKMFNKYAGENNIPSDLWGYMLNLIYSGNGEKAWEFCDMCWPSNLKGKEEFIIKFKIQLKQSPYWQDLAKLNGWI